MLAAHQQATREWWARREGFIVYTSRLVLNECRSGDAGAAAGRLAALTEIPLLEQLSGADDLIEGLMRDVPLPSKAAIDAAHIAVAAVHEIDYLLTWNCRHINNATLRARIEATCRAAGHRPPIICTPLQLLGTDQPDA